MGARAATRIFNLAGLTAPSMVRALADELMGYIDQDADVPLDPIRAHLQQGVQFGLGLIGGPPGRFRVFFTLPRMSRSVMRL